MGLNYGHPHNIFREEPFPYAFVTRGYLGSIYTYASFQKQNDIENLKLWAVVLLNMSYVNNVHGVCTNTRRDCFLELTSAAFTGAYPQTTNLIYIIFLNNEYGK